MIALIPFFIARLQLHIEKAKAIIFIYKMVQLSKLLNHILHIVYSNGQSSLNCIYLCAVIILNINKFCKLIVCTTNITKSDKYDDSH
jgi:hypothetical protein